ncbi:hypothetical protein BLOT_012326 [Blomia tropicalis]|nr:hypothetical protein BLOT_012326 [Blomia tropicalis]
MTNTAGNKPTGKKSASEQLSRLVLDGSFVIIYPLNSCWLNSIFNVITPTLQFIVTILVNKH